MVKSLRWKRIALFSLLGGAVGLSISLAYSALGST